MKRIFALFMVILLIPSAALAVTWWNDWREEDYDSRYENDYDSGYETGYEDGYYDGTHFPFDNEDDKPGAFAEWFLYEEWSERDLHAWKAVFDALFDGIDRNFFPKIEVVNPVYVANLTGTKYHLSESCSSLNNASSILELDIAEAIERGFEKCGRCGK